MKNGKLTKLLALTFALSLGLTSAITGTAAEDGGSESGGIVNTVSGVTHCGDFLSAGSAVISFSYTTEAARWTITKTENGYTVQEADGSYLSWDAESAAAIPDPAVLNIADASYADEDGETYNGMIFALAGPESVTYLTEFDTETYGGTDDLADVKGSLFYIYKETTVGDTTLWWKVSSVEDLNGDNVYVIIGSENGYTLTLVEETVEDKADAPVVVSEDEAILLSIEEISSDEVPEDVAVDAAGNETEAITEVGTEAAEEVTEAAETEMSGGTLAGITENSEIIIADEAPEAAQDTEEAVTEAETAAEAVTENAEASAEAVEDVVIAE